MKLNPQDQHAIETFLGISFQNPELLREAFTHTSFAHEKGISDNERLEFLGDSLLGFYVAERLFKKFPKKREGELTSIKANLVEASSCALYTQKLQIGVFLLLGKGEASQGARGKLSRQADLFEAVLGALYCDLGMKVLYQFLDEKVWPMMQELIKTPINQNWKALLQDYTQRNWHITPRYEVLSESGPEHAKVFTVGVFLDEREVGRGEGNTKKDAEKQASQAAIKELKSKDGR